MSRRMLVVLALLVGSARISSAAVEAFVVESARSSVAFEVRHLASFVVGTFSRFEGEFTLDRERLERSTATFAIEVASLVTDDARRTARLGREDFFATEQFPTIRFRSTGWRLAEAATYEITGVLTIKGVSKSVAVRVQPRQTTDRNPPASICVGCVWRSGFALVGFRCGSGTAFSETGLTTRV